MSTVPPAAATARVVRAVSAAGNGGIQAKRPFANGLFAWIPPLPAALPARTTLAVAAAGGTVLIRRHANVTTGAVRRLVFYGAARWRAHKAAYDKAVHVTTPLTSAPDGSLYF